MAIAKLGLYELLAPHFLLGFSFPDHIDRYLSVLQVTRLHTAIDERAVVYSGEVMFPPGATVREHRDPHGTVLRWEDLAFGFRMTVPRDGAGAIDDAVNNGVNPLTSFDDLLEDLGAVDETATAATDYPGFRFRLELMVPFLTFHLGSSWQPAKMGPDRRVIADPDLAGRSVVFVLPKLVLAYEQGDDLDRAPDFHIRSWGSSGFDAPADLAAGEVVKMDPPLAIHSEGRYAFGVDQVMVDFSEDHTPPEILALFGIDEAFQGIYIKSLRFSYGNRHEFAFNIGVTDALISLAGEVSFEAAVDLMGPQVTLTADVELFEGSTRKDYRKGRAKAADPKRFEGGSGTLLNTGIIHVNVSGGVPPTTTAVTLGGADIWDPAERVGRISPDAPTTLRPAGEALLVVDVHDAGKGASRQTYHEEILLKVTPDGLSSTDPNGSPADRPQDRDTLPQAELQITSVTPIQAGYTLRHAQAAPGSTTEQITVVGGKDVRVTVGSVVHTTRDVAVDVAAGQSVDITVEFDPVPAPEPAEFRLLFDVGKPHLDHWPASAGTYRANAPDPADARFSESAGDGATGRGASAVQSWIADVVASSPRRVTIDAHASFERATSAGADQGLSQRRREIAAAIAVAAGASDAGGAAHGHSVAQAAKRRNDPGDRVAILRDVAPPAVPAVRLSATIARDAITPAPPPPAVKPTPPPAPPANEAPDVFRRISARVRLIRNVPVLMELSGELDFETAVEGRLRDDTPAVPAGQGDLELEQQPAASAGPNAQDGVVDFVLRVTNDPATHVWTEVLALGAHPDDVDGLLRMTNSRSPVDATTQLKDAFGSVLLFAPVINASADSIDDGSAGGWVALGGVGGAAALGALGVFEIESVTLYGGELKARQFIPPSESATLSDTSVVFDYGVKFGISIAALGISTSRALKVRYRAIGFNLHFAGGDGYQPIFDTSRGYELDLSDPGLFDLPSPLGDLLKVLGARIARFNPLTLELDLGLKVDLGVVTIDRFLVKWPLDPLGVPSILPSGVSVDIPGTLLGSGRVEILQPPGPPAPADISSGGIEGSLDLTLVPMKLRVSASLGIRQTPEIGDRTATAVFLGITVDLPSPLPLAASGVGIYGFSGLFAMHYRRDEAPRVPGESVGPALKWLVKADGEPAMLTGPGGVRLWEPEFDRWSFGVGVMLGTMEGGFLLNLRGMFVLELPGPRILIFVKIMVVEPLEGLKPATDLQVGILGVVDLDFERETFTIGIIVDLEVVDVVELKLPIEVFFDLKDSRDWHVHIGTFQTPASARVLNIVRGYGYFMIGGQDITGWPGRGSESNGTLPGIAVATGVGASVTLGSESVGLYLKVAAGADLGVAFSPFFMAGNVYLDGILRLFIVSIEAHGQLTVEAPDPTYIKGEICGKVSFFFFSVKGCVGLEIGSNTRTLRAPDLVPNVWLQSHAPVLVAGQGGDRPIDASIGEAAAAGSTAEVPVVPIDTVPVVQFHASPLVANTTTFTEDLAVSPLQTPGGWVKVGGDRRVKYELTSLTLSPPLPGSERPDATWRRDPGTTSGGAKTNIDLALFSSVPVHGERALERSEMLDELVHLEWEGLCEAVAPAVCVLWTFCGQPLGPSGDGWVVEGTAAPDPPGTTRSTPAPTRLVVEEPGTGASLGSLLGGVLGDAAYLPAMIVGPTGPCPPGEPEKPVDPDPRPDPKLSCHRWTRPGDHPNPMRTDFGRVQVFDSASQPAPRVRIAGLGLGPGAIGIDIGHRVEILLAAAPSPLVRLRLVHRSKPARIVATDATGQVVAKAKMKARAGVSEQIELRGDIHRVVIEAGQNETLLLEWCAVFKRRPRIPFPLPTPFPTQPADQPLVPRPGASTLRERLVDEYLERADQRRRRADVEQPRPREGGGALSPLLARMPGELRATGHRGNARAGIALSGACCPVLQLPHRVGLRGEAAHPDLDPTVVEELGGHQNDQWVTLRIGQATQVRLLMGMDVAVLRAQTVAVRHLDRRGSLLRVDRLGDLDRTAVSGTTGGLPAEWLDPAGAWRPQVEAAATFLAGFANVRRELWTIKPEHGADRLQIMLDAGAKPADPPAVLVGVVEVCPKAEEERVQTEQEIRSGRIEALTGYLSQGAPVRLLEPNTQYTLTARYVPTSEDAEGNETAEAVRTQEFRFTTDDEPPKRLDPWVLASTPEHEEEFVFFEDAVRIVFNDLTLLQLYDAYGRQLRVKVRGADGVPLPDHDLTTLDPVAGEYTSPFWEFIAGMVAAGLLPCAGTLDVPFHGAITVPVPLAPLMAYTLDIEADPPLRSDPAKPLAPLFRRSFRTSRFASVQALVDDLTVRRIEHRALEAPVAGLPVDAVAVAADVALQGALRDAGDASRPAPITSGITIYWLPSGTGWRPHAILIDAAEPLWRQRSAPRVETVPGQAPPPDPAFKRIVPGTEDALRLAEQGGSHIQQFVRSPSGTRTLALIDPSFDTSAGGARITVVADRPASALYSISATSAVVLDVEFDTMAPWEDDVD